MFLSEGRHSDGRRVMSSDARAVLAPPVVGDIALLRLPAELQRHRRAVAAVLLRKLRPLIDDCHERYVNWAGDLRVSKCVTLLNVFVE